MCFSKVHRPAQDMTLDEIADEDIGCILELDRTASSALHASATARQTAYHVAVHTCDGRNVRRCVHGPSLSRTLNLHPHFFPKTTTTTSRHSPHTNPTAQHRQHEVYVERKLLQPGGNGLTRCYSHEGWPCGHYHPRP